MTKTDYLSDRYYVKCEDCYLWVWLGAIKHTMYFSCSDGMIIQPPSGDNLASCEFSDREGNILRRHIFIIYPLGRYTSQYKLINEAI